MKNIFFSVVLLFSSLHLSFGQVNDEQKLLSKVNAHWKEMSLSASENLRVNQCKTYHDLIRLHLTLVTEHLTLATAFLPLSAEIKQKRVSALSELTAYYQKGIFPLNTKYETPTPIFVDEAGTRCAVGQLIYKSGHDEIVNKISRESNLSYVAQLNKEYVELGDWAKENGFTVDELAWIQPTYGFVCNPSLNTGETVNASCHGGSDGGFLPDFSIFGPEYFAFSLGNAFYLNDSMWIQIPNTDCLQAGKYKQVIFGLSILNNVDTLEYYVEITEPDPMTSTYQIQGDISQCQASIEMYASGGSPPYDYILYNEKFDTLNNTNLCPGIYWMEVKDSHQCSNFDSLNLLSSGFHNPNDPILFKLFPNPTDGMLQLQTNQHYPVDYTIINVLGIKVGSGKVVSDSDQINLTNFPNGAYYFVLEDPNKHQRIFQTIIKTTF